MGGKRNRRYLKHVEAGGKGARSEERTMEAEHGASSSWFETDPNWTEEKQRDWRMECARTREWKHCQSGGATSALQDEEVVSSLAAEVKAQKWSDYHDVNGVLKPLPVQKPYLKQPFTDLQKQLIAGIRRRNLRIPLPQAVYGDGAAMQYSKLKAPEDLKHQ